MSRKPHEHKPAVVIEDDGRTTISKKAWGVIITVCTGTTIFGGGIKDAIITAFTSDPPPAQVEFESPEMEKVVAQELKPITDSVFLIQQSVGELAKDVTKHEDSVHPQTSERVAVIESDVTKLTNSVNRLSKTVEKNTSKMEEQVTKLINVVTDQKDP